MANFFEDEGRPANDEPWPTILARALMGPSSVPKRLLMGVKQPFDAHAIGLTQALPPNVVSAGNELNNWLADKTGLVGRLPPGGVEQAVAEQEKQYQHERTLAGQTGVDVPREIGATFSPATFAGVKGLYAIGRNAPVVLNAAQRAFALGGRTFFPPGGEQ
jgi:hypothetical protein